jgi:teichuronic acid biosynthesis glycosyltransferase TuaH
VNRLPGDWSDAVVLCAGTPWDGNRFPDQHMAERLARSAPVIYVDPPTWRGHFPSRDAGSLELLAPGLARLRPYGVPGIERPLLCRVNERMTRRAIATALRTLDASATALVLACCRDLLGAADERLSVFYGTDDFVAGAALMGVPEGRLRRRELHNLQRADRVVVVSEPLAEKWRGLGAEVVLIPNGVDDDLFAGVDEMPFPDDVLLPGPIAGFVGHLSNRIDLSLLEALAGRGVSILMVGPHQTSFEMERIRHLLDRPNVQWVGPKPFTELPPYLKAMDVGMTPYTDTPFNRGSFPLKTLEYLAAGRAVVATDLPSIRSLDTDLVRIATGPDSFANAVEAGLAEIRTPELVRARREFAHDHSWDSRADTFSRVLGLRTDSPAI